MGEDWEAAQPTDNIYLHTPYLTAIENAPPKDVHFAYLVFYKNNRPIGVAYCQTCVFRTSENVQDMQGGKPQNLLGPLTTSVKKMVAKRFEFSLLVCGNLLLTGEHGFYFDPSAIQRRESINLLEEALEKTQTHLKKRKINIDGLFIKDLNEPPAACSPQMKSMGYREFKFLPNMVFHVQPEWQGFDGYMQAISSKYRVRVKKAFQKGQPFEKIEFTEQQLQAHVGRLYELYLSVMDTAGFNMVVLNENYIVELKRQLGDAFTVTGYFLNGELVGYRTNILNFNELEAHFLGYDASLNRDYQLYMNMLLDSLRHGLELGVERIVFARTAMEIKSSIGAVPEDLMCFIRANRKFYNLIMSSLLEYFRPPDNWVQRNPFKDHD